MSPDVSLFRGPEVRFWAVESTGSFVLTWKNCMTNRQKQAQKTRTLIFTEAIALFREKGFDSVTVEEITQRAGTAKGTFYTYFRTKSDIIIEEFQTIDDYYRKYYKNLKRYEKASEKIVAFTRAQTRYVRDVVGLETLKILYSANIMDPYSDKILIKPERFLHEVVQEMVQLGQISGEFRTDKPASELATIFNRSMRSVFLDWSISNAAWDLVQVGVEFCEDFIVPALRKAL